MVKRKALVTGATGGLGRILCATLLSSGFYEVRATGRDEIIGESLETLGASFVASDLTKPYNSALLEDIDVVFHLAALSSPWGAYRDFVSVNVDATRTLLKVAAQSGCSAFVFASTPSIYAQPRDQYLLDESSPLPKVFANAYAETKFEAETLVLQANTDEMRTVALRPRAIVSTYDTVLLPRLMRAAQKGHMPVPGGGEASIELTDARDVASAFVAADNSGFQSAGKFYNISGGQPRPLKLLLKNVFSALDKKVVLHSVPTDLVMGVGALLERVCGWLPGSPEPIITRYSAMSLGFSQTFDLSGAKNALDWGPLISPERAIIEAIAGRQEHA